jgi:hypothetical protein
MRWKTGRRSSNVEDRRGQGHIVPDSFTHGSSQQRVRWFRRGFETGDLGTCDTFSTTDL